MVAASDPGRGEQQRRQRRQQQQGHDFPFDAVIVTFPDDRAAEAVLSPASPPCGGGSDADGGGGGGGGGGGCCCYNESPLARLSSEYRSTRFVATSDPPGARVGSGGGTVSAIAEYFALRRREEDCDAAPPKSDVHGDERILIIHAGGASSRCPTQMVLGKAWTSLPSWTKSGSGGGGSPSGGGGGEAAAEAAEAATTSPSPTSLLTPIHLWLRTCERLFPRDVLGGGPVVAVIAADVLVHFHRGDGEGGCCTAPSSAAVAVPFDGSCSPHDDGGGSVIGVAVPAPLETATRHGVYLLNDEEEEEEGEEEQEGGTGSSSSNRPSIRPCRKVLQKPSLDQLRRELHGGDGGEASSGAATAKEYAWIDTGAVVFTGEAARRMIQLATEPDSPLRKVCTRSCLLDGTCDDPTAAANANGNAVPVDLYTHILHALRLSPSTPGDEEKRQRYARQFGAELKRPDVADAIFDGFSRFPLKVLRLPRARFLHLGTTRELCDLLLQGTSAEAAEESSSPWQCNYAAFGRDWGMANRRMAVVLGDGRQRIDPTAVVHHSLLILDSSSSFSRNDDKAVDENFVEEDEPEPLAAVGSRSIVEHCCYRGQLQIGAGCFVSGLRNFSRKKFDISAQQDPLAKQALNIPDGLIVQQIALLATSASSTVKTAAPAPQRYVYMVLGVDDVIKSREILYGRSLNEFLEWSGWTESDLWGNGSDRTLWTASVHPILEENESPALVLSWIESYLSGRRPRPDNGESLETFKSRRRLSLSEIRDVSDAPAEFAYRSQLAEGTIPTWKVNHMAQISRILLGRKLEHINLRFVVDEYAAAARARVTRKEDSELYRDIWSTLFALDGSFRQGLLDGQYDVCQRTCRIASGFLEELSMASPMEDTRSEPTKNGLSSRKDSSKRRGGLLEVIASINGGSQEKIKAFDEFAALRNEQILQGPAIQSFAVSASDMQSLALLMTQRCICGAEPVSLPALVRARLDPVRRSWVIASAPSRVDISGAWTDTPPVCFELGGAVTGMAVTIDGNKPLSCRCRILKGGSGVTLRSESRDGSTGDLLSSTETRVASANDLAVLGDPQSDCALIKCALVVLGLASSSVATSDELDRFDRFQSIINAFCQSEDPVGLEIVSCSLLPHGSGLGTSSILGGCILASIARCVGIDLVPDDDDCLLELMDAILQLEQLLTTGGGYQDQCHGLVGGIKLATSERLKFPVKLGIEKLSVGAQMKYDLEKHIALAFTGKTRLAKNLLQTVLLRWSILEPDVHDAILGLYEGAYRVRDAILEGDLDELGKCLSRNWEHKKVMTGLKCGARPPVVRKVISSLRRRNAIRGASLCGAGGGGFMALLTSENVAPSDLPSIISEELPVSENDDIAYLTWHECKICDEGLSIRTLQDNQDGCTGSSVGIDDFDLAWHRPKPG